MPSSHIQEVPRTIPIDSRYDLVVAGGGIAGVAAALAGARAGVRTALIEKQCGLGGLATLGNVIMYLPLCDGYGRQVMGGLAEELIHLSVSELKEAVYPPCFLPVPDCWKPGGDLETRRSKRLLTGFNPYAFQMELERVLEEAGVDLWYDTRACQVVAEGKRLSHLVVENKSGRLAIEAAQFIDATGDADLCHLAGCTTENYPFNVLAGWFYEIHNGELRLNKFTEPSDKEHRGGGNARGPFYCGTDHRDVTGHVLATRRKQRQILEQKRARSPQDTFYPFGLPSIPTFRVTRRLQNRFSLSRAHCHQWLEDCLGITGDWKGRGPIYPIPLRSIQSDRYPNLFAAGRCISADHTVIDVVRAIGTCAVSGEACGMAAATLVLDRIDSGQVPVEKVRRRLIAVGGLIAPELMPAQDAAQAV